MNKQNRKTHDTENRATVARWEKGWGLDEKCEVIKKYKLVVTDSHEEIKYSTGNIVSLIVITVYAASWILQISQGHFVKYTIV